MTASQQRENRWRRPAFAAVAGAVVLTTGFIGYAPIANASSHREAPLIAGDPRVDNTDVYAFVSADKPDSVNLVANFIPFEEPNGGPNFYPFATDARYNINIDNNGDGKADLTYRWTFRTKDMRSTSTFLYNNGPVTSLTDPNLLFKQTYDLEVVRPGKRTETLARNVQAAPSFTGKASMPDYASLRDASVANVRGGGKTFAGQADDSFFADLRVFDLLYGGNLSETGQDTLGGYNVNTVALQIPKSAVALNGSVSRNPVVGVWSTTERRSLNLGGGKATPYGKYNQVSRLGNPLVNEVVIPTGLKDAFNSLTPDKDHTIKPVVDRVLNPELAQLIEKIYGVKAPAAPRKDLVEIYLTGISKNSGGPIQADLNSQLLNKDVKASKFTPAEELRINLGVAPTAMPNRLGVLAGDLQGFPNGRRLSDDVIDISIQAVEGAAQTGKLVAALATGDKVNANDMAFGTTFPYVALPQMTSVNADATMSSGSGSGSAVVPSSNMGGSDGTPVAPFVIGAAVLALLGAGAYSLRRRNGATKPKHTVVTSH